MFLIFDRLNKCIASCSAKPNREDLDSRQEFYVEYDVENLNDLQYEYKNGKVKKIETKQTIDEKIEEIKKEITSIEKELSSSNIVYKNHSYQTCDNSISKLMIAQNSDNIEWFDSDNNGHILTSEDIKNILSMIAERNTNIYKASRDVKDDIAMIYNNFKENKITENDAFEMLNNTLLTYKRGV